MHPQCVMLSILPKSWQGCGLASTNFPTSSSFAVKYGHDTEHCDVIKAGDIIRICGRQEQWKYTHIFSN